MIFAGKKSPMQTLEAELATLRSRRERIASKRASAQAEVEAAERARLELLTESDTDDAKAEAAAQARVYKARSALDALDAAAKALDERIAAGEIAVAAEQDVIERNATAEKIEGDIAAAEKTLGALAELRKFGEAFGVLGRISFDGRQIGESVARFADELETAATSAIGDARSQAAAVRNGAAKIPDLRPEPEAKPWPAPPARQMVFTVKPLKWTHDGTAASLPAVVVGKLLVAPAFFDIVLSPELAAKAIEIGAAVPIDHERAKKLRGTREWKHPHAPTCVALDELAAQEESAEEETSSQPQITATVFEQIDRGGPYIARARATVQ